MKHITYSFLVVLILSCLAFNQASGQVGIGTTTPNANAVLELKSPGNNQGFLVPRLTTAQRTAGSFVSSLGTSEKGLLVFDSDLGKFFYWQGSGWAQVDLPQDLNLTGNTLTITNNSSATPINLSGYIQDLSLSGSTLTVTNNPTATPINLSAFTGTNTDDQTLSYTGATGQLTISRLSGNQSVTITPAGTAGGDLTGSYPSPSVANNAITSAKISDGTIATADLADASVTSNKVVDGTLANADISTTAAIAVTKVAAGTNGQVLLTTGGVPTWSAMPGATGTAGGDLSGTYPNPTVTNDAITSAKILDATVASADLANNAVTSAKLQSDATVDANRAVSTNHLQDNSVTTAKINNGAVTAAKLSTTGVVAGSYGSGTLIPQVTVDAQGRVTAATTVAITGAAPTGAAGGNLTGTYPNPTIAAGAGTNIVTAVNDAATTGTINTGRLNTAVVLDTESPTGGDVSGNFGTGLQINASAVTTTEIADATIATADLANNAVTAGKLQSDATVDANRAVTTNHLQDNSVTTAKINNGAVTAAKLSTTGVTAGSYGSGTLIPQVTVDAQGRVTAATTVAITGAAPTGAAGGDLTGTYPSPTVATDAITTTKILDGTISNADINGSAAIAVSKVAAGTNGQVLLTTAGVPTWSAMPGPTGTAGGNLAGTYPNPTIATGAGTNIVTAVNDAATTGTINTGRLNTAVVLDTESPTGGDVSGNFGAGLQINASAVTTTEIADATIATADLADGSVTTAKILDATIATADLADGSVTSAKVVDLTLTNADISATAAVAVTKLAPGTNGQVLTTVLGAPAWQAPADGSASNEIQTLSIAGTTLTISGSGGNSVTLPSGGGVSGSGTAGQVAVWNGSTAIAGDNNLLWDDKNAMLGIGVSPKANFHFGGSHAVAFTIAKTGAHTVDVKEYIIFCDAGTTDILLPDASDLLGRILIVRATDAKAVTIKSASGKDTIDGLGGLQIADRTDGTTLYSVTLISVAAGRWMTISRSYK